MLLFLQSLSKIKSKALISIGFFCLLCSKSIAGDTIYIKFLDKQVYIRDHGFGETKVKDGMYLFVKERGDTMLNCFFIKKNKVVRYGKLKVVELNKTNIALRIGYWRNKKEQRFEDEFYIEDKLFMENF
jgi:hypothetical protein